jgi:hypothetical protein
VCTLITCTLITRMIILITKMIILITRMIILITRMNAHWSPASPNRALQDGGQQIPLESNRYLLVETVTMNPIQ